MGGAGGKGVWGKPGLELKETGTRDDVHDPNYDAVQTARMPTKLDDVVKPIIQEYQNESEFC